LVRQFDGIALSARVPADWPADDAHLLAGYFSYRGCCRPRRDHRGAAFLGHLFV